jgi:hypothetical protein
MEYDNYYYFLKKKDITNIKLGKGITLLRFCKNSWIKIKIFF